MTEKRGWVLLALQNCFYQLLHAESLEAGVVATVRAGGDTDTNTAICGAMLGAVMGINAVPEHWRETLLKCKPAKVRPACIGPGRRLCGRLKR
jgi:ADP-ribosyl-[dinitrogen reductase] hydrolase